MKRFFLIAFVATALSCAIPVQAALIDNGGGLIYDQDLNITWYDAAPVGRTWGDAMSWTAGLTVGGTAAGSWRLPTTTGSGNMNDGEMGHLYYDELGKTYGGPLGSITPFKNLLPGIYWSGTEYAPNPNSAAWYFWFSDGSQNSSDKGNYYDALAVHADNVGAPVPIPGGLWLLGPGLVGLMGLKRKCLG
jgi:hypothetical protein